jgi:acetoin utilization protein AcuB
MSFSDLIVEEFTSPIVYTVALGQSLDIAFELMQTHKIRHLPVVDGPSVVGIISDRDLATFIGRPWTEKLLVEDIMHTSLLTACRNESLGSVAFKLSSRKVGSAIILDEENSLYGIFTTTDALNALVELLEPNARARSDYKG